MRQTPHDRDRIELKVLQCLQDDGSISNLKLADAATLSPTAVLARAAKWRGCRVARWSLDRPKVW